MQIMNWRGILGIYAGFAVVLGGGWLWMRGGQVWTLGIIALGVVIALASVAHIVLAKRGPRPAKEPKPAKIAKGKAAPAADEDIDAAVKARLAAIAERTSGRTSVEEPVEELRAFAETDALDEPAPPELAEPEGLVDEITELSGLNDDGDHEDAPSQHVDERVQNDWDQPAPYEVALDDETATASGDWDMSWPPKAGSVSEVADQMLSEDDRSGDVAPVDDHAADAEFEDRPVAATDEGLLQATPLDAVVAPALPLDRQPGFPWSARYIALWAQEVRETCPEPFRQAVAHWQRWAVQQSASTPIVEEAAEEFHAMIDIWRGDFGDVPDLAAGDWPMRQLYREAEDDERLAALLPETLRKVDA